jgi:sulfate/thiosulfate-binding protein
MNRFFSKLRRGGTAGAPSAAARSRGGGLRLVLAAVLALGLAAAAAACGGSSDAEGADGSGGTIDLVAYSTPQELYEGSIEPAFAESPDGDGVGFKNSFGSSGDQSRAVEAGLPADFVHLPLEPDIQRLIDAGLIAEDYDAGGEGSPQNSVVVFVTRPGNPDGIDSWDDLVTGEVEVITANPFTSGGARWNIMAAYGSQIAQGASEDEALDFVAQVLENTPVQDASARDALQTFVGGKGDVLLSYENEAIQAQEAGEDVEYVVPDETILIETKAAVTEEADDPEAAQAFLDYLLSDEGQQLFAEGGYRPVNEEILAEHEDTFPIPKDLFTIEEFGGWETVATDFFDPENGSIAAIERDLGVATE